ncbi:MAG: HD domain-containing protein [Caldilinea sp.]|nr:HD domain-containing protein [Caldilineaceae bacterium]MCB9124304.1 HD domain-containing protein [Caldilineaceae bacterium]MCO5210927.1 HD domain-containing protein [Caldilinea sp.]
MTTTLRDERDWRALSRQMALSRAEDEARQRLHLAEDEPLPFNYRWEHVRRVVQMALWLADETGADRDTVEAAAWLHDICKSEPNHGAAGAAEAQWLLPQTDFPREKVPAVVDAIARHVGLRRPKNAPPLTPVETAVLWDADKLTKLGVGVLAYNLSMRQFDGLSLAERRQDLRRFTVDVLSKTVTSMNTAPARRLAEERYRSMVTTLDLWESEDDEL